MGQDGNRINVNKVVLTIRVEVLHIDTAGGMIQKAKENIREGFIHGSITSDDGDRVEWKTENERIVI